MPSERVSDGILFDGDISAAVCPYVVIWRSFCRVISDFTRIFCEILSLLELHNH
ncbi:TPA: hypothetical protein WIJ51_000495 [Neisseria meningitidis]